MSAATTSLQKLRRMICTAERMDFYLRFMGGAIPLTGSPTNSILYSSGYLTQEDGHWTNSFVLTVSGAYQDQERTVASFVNAGATLNLDYAFGFIPAAGDLIELTEIWPPSQIHAYINQTIDDYGRNFLDTIVDETLVICKDKLIYDLTTLARTPRNIAQIFLEHNTSRTTMTATAGAAGYVNVGNNTLTNDQFNGWKVSIYGGTGAGQLRTVSDTKATGSEIDVSVTWTTVPDATSLICLWNPNVQQTQWERLEAATFDSPEWPNTLYLMSLYTGSYGMRMRILYSSEPPQLTTELDTTTMHAPLIVNAVRGLLHTSLTSDSRADSNRHSTLANFYNQLAEKIAQDDSPRRPTGTVWVTEQGSYRPDFDPLNMAR